MSQSKFKIETHGNGWAYTITCRADGRSVFLQDGDAVEFGGELEAATKHGRAWDDVCADYSEVMQ